MKTLSREQEIKAQIISDKCVQAVNSIIENEQYTLKEAITPEYVREIKQAARELVRFNI